MKLKSLLCIPLLLFCAQVNGEITGPPIENNDYNLDLRYGPVIGSARQVALGGAYIGIAEGITSLSSNPSGVALRLERSTTKFDWDWTASWNNLDSNDFDNNGQSPPNYQSHVIRSLGIMAQYGQWGVGVLNDGEVLALDGPDDRQDEYVLSTTTLALGKQFLERELTVGVALRATMTKLRDKPVDTTLGRISGTGWEAGVVWNPYHVLVRLGVAYSSSISSNQTLDSSGGVPVTVNGLIVPQQAILPATFGTGISYTTASAPFWQGHKWLVAGDLLFTASSHNAVGVESVLAQKKQPIGEQNTTSIRIGSELETSPGRLRLRAGSYYEPSFYESVAGRTHITGGFEVRMFHSKVFGEHDWGLSASVDTARDYLNIIAALGYWYY